MYLIRDRILTSSLHINSRKFRFLCMVKSGCVPWNFWELRQRRYELGLSIFAHLAVDSLKTSVESQKNYRESDFTPRMPKQVAARRTPVRSQHTRLREPGRQKRATKQLKILTNQLYKWVCWFTFANGSSEADLPPIGHSVDLADFSQLRLTGRQQKRDGQVAVTISNFFSF